MPTIAVRNDPDGERYVAEIGAETAGYTVYHLRHGIYFFAHTEIEDRFTGQGIGKTLVRSALDDVRAHDGTIVPICPYVAGFINRNPEYEDLVDHEIFDRIADRLHT
jgi:uncharacterized protein